MRMVEVGSKVIFNREEVRVVDQYSENGWSYFVLETREGRRSVPISKIMWNGKSHFVTAEGHSVAEMMESVEKVVRSIKKHMKIWDSENEKPSGIFYRDEVIDSCFMDFLRNEMDSKNDEELGFIVKRVVRELEDI